MKATVVIKNNSKRKKRIEKEDTQVLGQSVIYAEVYNYVSKPFTWTM